MNRLMLTMISSTVPTDSILLLLLLLLLYSINTKGQPGRPGSLNTELVINTNAYSNTLKLDRMD